MSGKLLYSISIYFYSKTNQMRNISNLFYFGTTIYMFRTVPLSIIRSLRLSIQHQVYVIQVLWLLASRNEMELSYAVNNYILLLVLKNFCRLSNIIKQAFLPIALLSLSFLTYLLIFFLLYVSCDLLILQHQVF
jgi:hypothetical protein